MIKFIILGLIGSIGINSTQGVFYVNSARVPDNGGITINPFTFSGFYREFEIYGYKSVQNPNIFWGRDQAFVGDLKVGFGFNLPKYFEMGVNVKYSIDGVITDDNVVTVIDTSSGIDTLDVKHQFNKVSYGFSGFTIPLKLSLPYKKVFALALMTEVSIPFGDTGFRDTARTGNNVYFKGGWLRKFNYEKIFTGISGLISFTPTKELSLHFEYGLKNPKTLKYGVGLYVSFERIGLWLEDYYEKFQKDYQVYGKNPFHITSLGLRLGRESNSHWNFYVHLVHSVPDTAKYPRIPQNPYVYPLIKPQIGFGFNLNHLVEFKPREKEAPPPTLVPAKIPETPKGTIFGIVLDEESKQPVRAKLELIKEDTTIITFSDSITGQYSFKDVPTGLYTLKVEKEGYKAHISSILVMEKQTITRDIEIRKILPAKEESGIFTGTIYDKNTNRPLQAIISILSHEKQLVITSDSLTGIFRIDLKPGLYTVQVSSENYISITKPVVIRPNEITVEEFSLMRKGTTIVFRNIYFKSGSSKLEKGSEEALEEIYKFLVDNPRIIVEIQGHTDSSGSFQFNMELSKRRAEEIKRYLVSRGIEETRIVAKGYGPTRPIAPNDTPENRAKNRRVEVVIIGEKTY